MTASASGNPGDVVITATINGMDVSKQLRNLAVFEDIKKPYTVIQAVLFDNTDILNRASVFQSALMQVSFGQVPDQDPYSGTWILSTVKVHRPSENYRTTYWSLQGYSPHMFALPRVQKSYTEIPMTDVVGDLVNSYLPAKIKGLIIRAPARNLAGSQNMPYVVNNQQVFKAIRDAMMGSASAVDLSSVYTLFENRNNLVLDTMEHIINSPISGGPVYSQKQVGTDFFNDVATQQYSIITYREDDRIDTTALIQAGSQQVSTYDMFSQNFKTALQGFGAMQGVMPGLGSAISQIPYNMFRPPTFRQQTAAPRRLVAAQFDSQSITAQVPLNPVLTVGTSVTLNVVGALGDLQGTSNPDWHSGLVLIAETRHSLVLSQGRMQGTTTVKGIPPSVLQ